MDRKQFVEEELSRMLKICKPNLVKCEYIGSDAERELCRVHCENNYYYDICIEADSFAAIVYDVFKKMMYK